MNKTVAFGLCVAFVLWLFWIDRRQPYQPSPALWIPLAWMFLAGSRYLSSWLNISPPLALAHAEGSPVDAAAFLALIIAGAIVLLRRNLDWHRAFRDNKWIVLYFLYALSSILWTDEPYLLAKRWLKDLGIPIMALVILTEQRPYEALGVVLRRLSFLLLPLSVVFIKYFPELGRVYHHDGTPLYTGVGHQKNQLGLMCLISGIYLAWLILQDRWSRLSGRWIRIGLLVLLATLAWLLHMSDSKTSLACLLAVVGILLVARLPRVRRRPSGILSLLIVAVATIALANELFDLKSIAFDLLERDPTLTNRTNLWQIFLGMELNPWVGSGFMSFWTGERLQVLWNQIGARIVQAHNGYIEQYLNLGYLGIAFILAIVLSGLHDIRRQLNRESGYAMLRLCFVVAALLYNYTEASFYGVNNMWLLLLLACLVPPARLGVKHAVRLPTSRPAPSPKAQWR